MADNENELPRVDGDPSQETATHMIDPETGKAFESQGLPQKSTGENAAGLYAGVASTDNSIPTEQDRQAHMEHAASTFPRPQRSVEPPPADLPMPEIDRLTRKTVIDDTDTADTQPVATPNNLPQATPDQHADSATRTLTKDTSGAHNEPPAGE